uniref:Uncharacterized protein n=1 Tax=Meloidogyne hapla TaxID=6305 RepID=A0A1I8BJ25_MELHA
MIIIIIQICYCMENEDNEARKLLTKIGNKRKAGDQTKENEKEKAAANILVQISKKKENTTLSVNNTEETASKINDYLSYNIQTNIFNNQTIEFLPLNYTEIYQSLLNKISNNCLTANEVVEMVGNRYKAGFAVWHLNILTEPAVKQIGINELRIGFRLKTQKTVIVYMMPPFLIFIILCFSGCFLLHSSFCVLDLRA